MSGREPRRVFRTTHRTPEEIAADEAVRARYRNRPSYEELMERGDLDPAETTTQGECLELLRARREK